MSVKQKTLPGELLASLRVGGVCVALLLVLLLPCALLIARGAVGERAEVLLVSAASFIAALLAGLLAGGKKREGLLPALLSAAVAAMLLLLLGAGMPQCRLNPGGMLPFLFSLCAGMCLAALVQNNDRFSRKRRKRKKYN